MSRSEATGREAALARARDHSPFLRDALAARTEVAAAFLDRGAEAAVELALIAAPDAAIHARRRLSCASA